jgi:hypothetical protein
MLKTLSFCLELCIIQDFKISKLNVFNNKNVLKC